MQEINPCRRILCGEKSTKKYRIYRLPFSAARARVCVCALFHLLEYDHTEYFLLSNFVCGEVYLPLWFIKEGQTRQMYYLLAAVMHSAGGAGAYLWLQEIKPVLPARLVAKSIFGSKRTT